MGSHRFHRHFIRFFIGRGSAMLHRLPNILSPLWGSSVPKPKSRSDDGFPPSKGAGEFGRGGMQCNPCQTKIKFRTKPRKGRQEKHRPPTQKVYPRRERADFVIGEVSPPVRSTGHAPLSAKPCHFRIVLWIILLMGYGTSQTKRTENPLYLLS